MTASISARLRTVYGAARAREPWSVLVPLLVLHWLALGLFVESVNHNGWLFYQGGDQIWQWTTGWLLGSGDITEPLVAQGWSLLIAPFAVVGDPGFVSGLPGAILLQVFVFAPLALWCMYELGARIGGRVVGYAAAAIWTLVPYAVIPLFQDRYHAKYVEQFLPHPLGLTAMADQAGVVALLGAALFTLRAVQSRDPRAAVVAGLLAGYAGLIKPSSLLFLPAPFVALALSRRWREGLVFAVALAPALGALTLWKDRGFGFVPAFTYGEVHVAAGVDTLVTKPYDRYIDIDWHHLDINLLGLGEVFWSLRVLQWLPFAGAIAVARRSVPLALFLSTWFWIFFVIKGSAEPATVDSGSFFRLLMPAFPALVLLVAALPVLVPRFGIDLARRTELSPAKPLRMWALGAAVLVLAVAPLVAAAAVSPLKGPQKTVQFREIAVPVGGGLDLRAAVAGQGTVSLHWDKPGSSGVKVFYKVLRTKGAADTRCYESAYGGADECSLLTRTAGTTTQTSAVDRPPRGTWTYRVGAGANWLNDPKLGDVFLVSEPVTVTVP